MCAVVMSAASACQTRAGAAESEAPQLAVTGHEFQVRRHIGQTVRVCGRLTRIEHDWAVQHMPAAGETYFHGYPAVLVKGCGAAPPRLDRGGCITGRVAARDGGLTLPAARTVVADDSPIDRDWLLHPQCRVARGD
jgi:hypothetical protein